MDQSLVVDTIERLRHKHVRITPQRQAILEYIIVHETHPTADEIYRALSDQFPTMSVATVYNNLRTMKELGVLKEMTFGDGSSRFDFALTNHYHVICQNCGRVDDLYYPILEDVDAITKELTNYQVTSHRLEVYGLCPDCQAKLEVEMKES